jgi:hypothetical protein
MKITLKTLPEATPQQVFDKVARHLIKQQARSTDEEGFCAYKAPGRMRCAAGCLISSDEYSPKMERNNWASLVKMNIAPKRHCLLIEKLQKIHDEVHISDWLESLRDLALTHELNTSVLDKK